MSELIRQLHTDHVNIARLLDLVEEQLEALHAGDAPDYVLMADIMQYMTNYPDLVHHPKEDLVFDKLAERDSNTRLIVKDLIAKHGVLAEKGSAFLDSIRMVMNEHLVERDTLESQGREYVSVLRDHMNVEEAQVFPAATKALVPEDWSVIDEAMEKRDDPLFGKVVENEYGALYDYIRHRAQ